MERVIFHCDLNSFYASVELLAYPQFRQLPVAVCGNPKSRHGIVLAKNEIAKGFGVTTGQTIWEARLRCPDLILLPSHGEKYRYYSEKINNLYLQYTDLVEPYGIDESWLDVTGSLHLFGGDPMALAQEIRERSLREYGLSLSIGVSFNKIFAKLGSDYKKPNASTLITKDHIPHIVFPLPVGDLLYVGKATEKILHSYGIYTIGQLAATPVTTLEIILGKAGYTLHRYANGLEDSPVKDFYQQQAPKTLGQGLTFAYDLEGAAAVRSGIVMLADHVALRLRRHKLQCCGVQIHLRDPNFRTISRQTSLPHSSHLGQEISHCAFALAEKHWDFRMPVRAISVTAQHLLPLAESGRQLSLFDNQESEKWEKLAKATDIIREKYGRKSISLASTPQKERGNCSIGFSLDPSSD